MSFKSYKLGEVIIYVFFISFLYRKSSAEKLSPESQIPVSFCEKKKKNWDEFLLERSGNRTFHILFRKV